jgi:hypothetical protein
MYIPVGPMGVPIVGNLNVAGGHDEAPKANSPAK